MGQPHAVWQFSLRRFMPEVVGHVDEVCGIGARAVGDADGLAEGEVGWMMSMAQGIEHERAQALKVSP